MSVSCPVGPEFNELVNHFNSKAAALAAVSLNKGEIPSIEEAEKLLNTPTILDEDSKLERSSNDFILSKLIEEEKDLSVLKTTIKNKKQKEAIQKLIIRNNEFQKAIKDAKKRGVAVNKNSVTNLIGSDFTGDPLEYKKTKLFGIFIHDYADMVIRRANDENVRLTDISNDKEFFTEKLKEFYSQNYFKIENVSDDALFEMTKDLVEKIAYLKGTEHIILPELTIVGKGSNGDFILGRIDLLQLTPKGEFKIFDFKTKKVPNLIGEKDLLLDGIERVDNINSVLLKLMNQSFKTVEGDKVQEKRASAEIVKATQFKRTVYDTWALQTSIYENILIQSGLSKAADSSIIALFYQMDDDNKKMLARAVHMFENEDYYGHASSYLTNANDDSLTSQRNKIKKLKAAVEKEIPTGKQNDIDFEDKKETKLLEFTPTKESDELLRDMIIKNFETQIKEVSSKIKSLERKGGNVLLLKVYEEQQKTLISFKRIYDQVASVEDKRLMHNYAVIHNSIKAELQEVLEKTKKAIEKYRSNPQNTTNFLRQSEIIRTAYKRTKSLEEVIELMETVLRDAMSNPSNNLNENSEIVKSLNSIRNNVEIINSIFNEISLEGAVKMISSLGEKTFQRVEELKKEPIELEIKKLERQIEELKNGKPASFLSRFKGATISLISKPHRDKFKQGLTPDQQVIMTAVEDLEYKILRLKGLLNMNYDDQSLKDYINGVTNPSVLFYAGAKDVMQPNGLFSGLMIDHMIASAGNSDLTISAFTNYLKNVKVVAMQNVQEDFAIMNFDNSKEELLKVFDINQINDMVSEKRTKVYYDYKTNELKEKTSRYFVKPTSEEYDRIYNSFSYKYKQFQQEIRQLKESFRNKLPGSPEFLEAEKNYYEKIEERNKFSDTQLQWLVDNTSLPYAPEFYEYQQKLPYDIRNQIQKKYHEIEIIKASLDISYEEYLTEEDMDRIEEIEFEIRQLKQQAKELNPEYEKYIELFNSLYELEEDSKRFEIAYNNAKIKYEVDDPEKWQKWLDKNTIIKIKPEWYETLNTLYEERNFIMQRYFGENIELQELLEEKRKILAPHKVNGVLKISRLDADTIANLDRIQNEINEIYDRPKKKVKFEKEDSDALTEINNAIEEISKLELVKDYDRVFRSKTKNLENKYANYIDAKANLIIEQDTANTERLLELESQYNKYENEFFLYEQEYEKWYNGIHENSYKSITINENSYKDSAIPKLFNYQRTVSENAKSTYMEEKPSPKYVIKSLRKDAYYDNFTNERLTEEQLEEFTQEQLDEDVANGKLKFVKGVYNDEFLKSADGIPMPKNIEYVNGVYRIKPGMENMTVTDPETGKQHLAVNQNYIKLMNNPQVFDFYNKLMNMYFKLQNKVDGRRTGYLVPGALSTTTENLSRFGLKETISKQFDKYVDKQLKGVTSEYDFINNIYNEEGDIIQLPGTRQYSEELQTTDNIAALMEYAANAHYNIAMQEAAPVAEMTIEYFEQLSETIQNKIQAKDNTFIDPVTKKRVEVDWNKRFKEINKVIEILKFEKRKFVNGQATNPEEKGRKLTKGVKQIMAYTSFVRMGFDVVNQTKNFVSGNVQAFIAAGGLDGSAHYSRENWAWAKKQLYTEFLPNYLADWGKINDVSESTLLYRLYNPLQKEFDKYLKDITGTKKRRAIGKFANLQELAYMLQDKGDTEVGITVMYSVLDSYRYKVFTLDSAGNKIYKKTASGEYETVKAHEVYYQDANKVLKIRSDVEFTKEDENFLRRIIVSEMRRAQGNYASWDQTKFEENIWGKLVFYYRKYIIPQFLNRFGYLRTNWEGAEVSIGYWRSLTKLYQAFGFWDTTKYFLLGKRGKTAINPAVIGKVYTKGVSQARRDFLAMAILTVLSSLALQYVKRKDDEDEELGMIDGNAIRLLWGVKGETVSMFPLGGGSEEYIKNFTTLTTYLRELKAVKKLGVHALYGSLAYIMNGGEEPTEYDSEFYEEIWKEAFYNKKSGAYEKGDLKLTKDFVDLTGVKNIRDMFDPNYRIDQLKRNQ